MVRGKTGGKSYWLPSEKENTLTNTSQILLRSAMLKLSYGIKEN